MELFVYIMLLLTCIRFGYSDTGSGQLLPKNNMKLKEILMDIKKDIRLNTDARRDLDKELSELTRRYRELVIENNDIKRELVETKDELTETKNTIAKNVTSVKTELKEDLSNVYKAQTDSENKTSLLLSKLQSDTDRKLEVAKNNMTSIKMDLTVELADIVKTQEDSNNNSKVLLSNLQTDVLKKIGETKKGLAENITYVARNTKQHIDDIKRELWKTESGLTETKNAIVENITSIAKNVSSVKTDITDKLDKTNVVSHNRTRNLLSELQTYLEKELEVTKNDIVNNMTSVSMDLTNELKDLVKVQADSNHTTGNLLSKLQSDLKRELKETTNDIVNNITSVTADTTKKFDSKLKIFSSTYNRTDIRLSKLRGAMSSLNQTLTSAIKSETLQRAQQAREIGKLKQETENSDTKTNQAIARLNGTLMNVATELVQLQEKVDYRKFQYQGKLRWSTNANDTDLLTEYLIKAIVNVTTIKKKTRQHTFKHNLVGIVVSEASEWNKEQFYIWIMNNHKNDANRYILLYIPLFPSRNIWLCTQTMSPLHVTKPLWLVVRPLSLKGGLYTDF